MNKLKHEFDSIKWPNEFIVIFKDGMEKVFTSDKGVYWDNGKNLDGEYENRPNISCCLKKKSPNQQKHKIIEFFVDEVKQFKTLTGKVIWEPSV